MLIWNFLLIPQKGVNHIEEWSGIHSLLSIIFTALSLQLLAACFRLTETQLSLPQRSLSVLSETKCGRDLL